MPEYEAAILALDEPIRKSHAKAKPSPPPAHAPLIAATQIVGD